jgi:EEF1A N-terminal glycine/lysine methyltransferase
MALSPEDSSDEALDLFQEPADFYEAEKPPTSVEYRLKDGQLLNLRLIGHSPLWVRQ